MGLVALAVALALALIGCGPQEEGGLSELQLIGVDFELNSIIVSNNGSTGVRTDGLWAYRDGEAFEFDIFTVQPRATVLFSMRDLGEISVTGGEIALAEGDDMSDPDALLQYVAWGDDGSGLGVTATEAGLWPSDETVATSSDTVVLIRTDPTSSGPTSWEASSEVG